MTCFFLLNKERILSVMMFLSRWLRYTMSKWETSWLLMDWTKDILDSIQFSYCDSGFITSSSLTCFCNLLSFSFLKEFPWLQITLEIRNSSQTGLNVPDASLVRVTSTYDVIELMTLGQRNRAVGATALNDRSSRSHRFGCISSEILFRCLTSTLTSISECIYL